MRTRDRWAGLTCVLLALGACGLPEHPREAERPAFSGPTSEMERVIADVESAREKTRLAMMAGRGDVTVARQAQFEAPCPPYLCQPDIDTAVAMECGAFYPAYWKSCDGLSCSQYHF